MIAGSFVNPIPIHFKVIMNHNMAHALDVLPRNLWMLLFQQFGKTPPSLPDDHDMAKNVRLSVYLRSCPNDTLRRSEFARVLCWSQNWTEANEQFNRLGKDARVKLFGSQQKLEEMRAEAEKNAEGSK